jgi:hypothetical protein
LTGDEEKEHLHQPTREHPEPIPLKGDIWQAVKAAEAWITFQIK